MVILCDEQESRAEDSSVGRLMNLSNDMLDGVVSADGDTDVERDSARMENLFAQLTGGAWAAAPFSIPHIPSLHF